MVWRANDGVRWLEADVSEARAALPTRLGGVSAAPYDSLNLGVPTDDETANVVENRRRLATALGFEPDRVAYTLQVHGTELSAVAPSFHGSFVGPDPTKEPRDALAEADGQVLSEPGVAALVFTADCL